MRNANGPDLFASLCFIICTWIQKINCVQSFFEVHEISDKFKISYAKSNTNIIISIHALNTTKFHYCSTVARSTNYVPANWYASIILQLGHFCRFPVALSVES